MREPNISRLLPRLALALGGLVGSTGPALAAAPAPDRVAPGLGPMTLSNSTKAALLEAVVADHLPSLEKYLAINKLSREDFVASAGKGGKNVQAGHTYDQIKEFGDTIFDIAAKGTDATPDSRIRRTVALSLGIDKATADIKSLNGAGVPSVTETPVSKTQVVTTITFLAIDGIGKELMPLFNPILPSARRAAARMEMTAEFTDDIMAKNKIPKWNMDDARPVVRSDILRVMTDLSKVQAGIANVLRKGAATVPVDQAASQMTEPFADIGPAFDKANKDAQGFQDRIAYRVPARQPVEGQSSITIRYGKVLKARSLGL